VDKPLRDNLRDTLQKLHTRMGIVVAARRDPGAHTVVIILQLRKLPGTSPGTDSPGMMEPSIPTTPHP
jgi:hypothetical protein